MNIVSNSAADIGIKTKPNQTAYHTLFAFCFMCKKESRKLDWMIYTTASFLKLPVLRRSYAQGWL